MLLETFYYHLFALAEQLLFYIQNQSFLKLSSCILAVCVDHNKLENSSRDGNTRPPDLPPEKSVFIKQQLEPDMEQQTGSKLGKEYFRVIYCHPAYLTSMQSTSCKMLGWMKHKLESRLLGEISISSDMHTTPPLLQEVKKN